MNDFDLVCLSHLRWNLVFQRPQHLMTRFARERRVFFVEEGIDDPNDDIRVEIEETEQGVTLVRPYFSLERPIEEMDRIQQTLLDEVMVEYEIDRYALWFYAPMAVGFTRHLTPFATAYDCMDELASFAHPPLGLHEREAELFERSDVVYTGGHSLYQSKRRRHSNVHCFPSSVDVAHFASARSGLADPPDQAPVPRPRLGYAGVIDERVDHDLVGALAAARPDWHLVMLGPISNKIAEADVPRAPNIHYLGGKRYGELPDYLSGWDVGLMPFALNDATRYISPTKTPEYLAAGLPVVSTPIRDVVREYADAGLVEIARTAEAFAEAGDRFLRGDRPSLETVDAHLSRSSWDATWSSMSALLDDVAADRANQGSRGTTISSRT